MKLAIIGAGPSAFYVASRILSTAKSNPNIRIHMFDRVWAPHGLVRYGVAPDHPEVKVFRTFLELCTHKFDGVAEDPRFRFFGNVDITSETRDSGPVPHAMKMSLSSLLPYYSHLLFASGCDLPRLHPALIPSKLCIPALSFVHWYTQHPSQPIKDPPLDKISHVSIIGNGNVSLDIARILLTPPSLLAKYDLPQSVLNVLHKSTVKHVSIIARRGPLEAAFTTKELREMILLPDASLTPLDPSLFSVPENIKLTRQQTRMLDLLKKGSKNPPGTTSKTWSLDFYRSPLSLSSTTPAKLTLAHTKVDPSTGRAIPTEEITEMETDLVITSLGSHAHPSTPFYDATLGHIRCDPGGRVIRVTGVGSDGDVVKNVYASGWAALGARGVINTTMMNAYNVAHTILSDLEEEPTELSVEPILGKNALADDTPPPAIQDGLARGDVVDYIDWKVLDAAEIARAKTIDSEKERERMSWDEAKVFVQESRNDRMG